MSSRRKRLTMLRATDPGSRETDEPNDSGMDASHEPQDAGRDAARSRSAPAFCVPQAVPPKPYRSAGGSLGTPRSAAVRPGTERPIAPRSAAVASAYETPRLSSPRPAAPVLERETRTVRPFWEDAPDEDEEESSRPPQAETPTGPAWTALARGVSLLFGTLLAIELFQAGGLPEQGPWWLDTRPLPPKGAAGLLGLSAAALAAFGVRGALPRPVRAVTTLCLVLLIALALKNATVYYGLLKRGDLHAGPPVAFPLHVAACLGVVLIAVRSAPRPGGFRDLSLTLVGFNAALLGLTVAQVACCGPIDARRPGAAAVVLGPRPFESDAEARLDGRARRAVELYQTGLVPKFLLAGGPEGERLARLKKIALDGGVPEASIEVLPAGNEMVTATELRRRFPSVDGEKPTLLIVSDFDHLPRAALVARRSGLNVATVPTAIAVKPDRGAITREIVELWRCYFGR